MAGITYLSTGAEFSFNPLSIDSEIIDVNEIQSDVDSDFGSEGRRFEPCRMHQPPAFRKINVSDS
jgi:hypothetical protein